MEDTTAEPKQTVRIVKDWLTVILAVVGIISFAGNYMVNDYRLDLIEKRRPRWRKTSLP